MCRCLLLRLRHRLCPRQVLLAGLLLRSGNAHLAHGRALLNDCHALAVLAEVKGHDRAAVGVLLGVADGGGADALDLFGCLAARGQTRAELVVGELQVALLLGAEGGAGAA